MCRAARALPSPAVSQREPGRVNAAVYAVGCESERMRPLIFTRNLLTLCCVLNHLAVGFILCHRPDPSRSRAGTRPIGAPVRDRVSTSACTLRVDCCVWRVCMPCAVPCRSCCHAGDGCRCSVKYFPVYASRRVIKVAAQIRCIQKWYAYQKYTNSWHRHHNGHVTDAQSRRVSRVCLKQYSRCYLQRERRCCRRALRNAHAAPYAWHVGVVSPTTPTCRE